MKVDNRDIRQGDYEATVNIPRPSHADWTYRVKYGVSPRSGGGRASARETVGRVAGGAVAGKLLAVRHGVAITAWVSSVGTIEAPDLRETPPTRAEVDSSIVRCPDPASAAAMEKAIMGAADDGDSLGGVVTCVATGVPAGWGEPVFGKTEALLAAAMLSIPAAKGFETGSGFAGTRMRGSEHNDPFVFRDGTLLPRTNRAGGVLGGITSGAPVVFRVAFKPVATIRRPQETVDYDGRPVVLEPGGRHDPCVVPRAVPVVESMAALVLADLCLLAVRK
jgi:chorismate synthase